MAREFIILECTEAKAEGKPISRYISTRNKKSPNTPNRLEKKKYNPNLKRHTLLLPLFAPALRFGRLDAGVTVSGIVERQRSAALR